MDEYQQHDLEDSTEDLKADLIKLTQLLESELDEIDQFEAEDSLNEGEEDWPQLYAAVGSDESPDVGQHKRRSRELPAGIPLELIEEDRRAREQRRRPGRQRFSGIEKDDDVSSDEEATGTPYNRDAVKEDGSRQTLTGRRLKRKRSDRGSVSPRDPGADGHEEDADEEDAEPVEAPQEEEAEDEDVGEEHTKEHISAAEDSCESPSQDENVLDAMEGDDEKTASDVSADAGRDNRSGEVRQMIAVKVEDFYDDDAERGDDYEEEFARAPKRKRPAKPASGRKGSKKKMMKKKKKKQRRSFEDRRDAWDVLWEEKFQELVKWKEEKGVCAVGKSDNNKTLAWWIHEQRRKMRHGTLTEYRRARLESIGFVWSSDLDGRAGRRRRYLAPQPKDDAISVVHLAPADSHELAMATMMTTIMKRPSNGGRCGPKATTFIAENGDDDRMEDEEEPIVGTRMQLRSASPKNLPEPEESLPTHLACQSGPVPSFYDVFLKREEERKRDKEAMEAMLARLQEERDNDKERISRLEEVVRQLSEKARATSSTHAVANNSKRTKSKPSIKIEAPASDTEGSVEAACPTGTGGGRDLSAEPNNVPVPPPYPPSPATSSPTTLAPASLQTPVNIGVVEAVSWKREQHQQQQREKIRNEREQAKARGMHQLLEDGKILANVEELEIEQFFV